MGGNRDAVEFYAFQMDSYVDYGPAGHLDSVGNAVLSTRPFENGRAHVLLPKSDSGDLNRFMVINRFKVNGVYITIASVHLEWFGNPSSSIEFIRDYFASTTEPVIVLGDFNLEPNGGNDAAPDADAWNALAGSGWTSATPQSCSNTTGMGLPAFDSHIACPSNYTTCLVHGECAVPCIGYQLDWIIFKSGTPEGLTISNVGVDYGLVDSSGSEPGTGPWCSDHTM